MYSRSDDGDDSIARDLKTAVTRAGSLKFMRNKRDKLPYFRPSSFAIVTDKTAGRNIEIARPDAIY